MAAFLLLSRLLLAAVLGVAGVAKLLDRDGSRRALLDFGAPARIVGPTALVLPLVELGAAAALVPDVSARWGALVALGLLGVFSVAIGVALVRGRRPSCHCFGRLHSAPAGWRTLLRNTGLAALAGTVVLLVPGAPVLSAGERLVILGVAAVTVVVAAQAWLWFQLLRQNGRILARLDEVERGGLEAHADVLIGSPAPAFDLPSAEGGRLSLAGLLARNRPVLLVFGHSGCGPCQELLPQLARWQQERGLDLTVALVSEGALETASSVQDVALQVEREVAVAYGVTATPAALLIDRDGRIMSTLALGADAITALVPEPASQSEAVGRRDAAFALGLAAGGAVLATAGTAAAATSQPRHEHAVAVDDPELLGLRMAIKLANPRLVADAREVQRALLSLSRAKRKQPARAAAQAALRRERTHVLALRKSLRAVPTHGKRAGQAKQLAVRSLSLLADGLERFGRAVASPRASDSSRLLKQAQKPFQQARSLAYAANVLLGCTGKDC